MSDPTTAVTFHDAVTATYRDVVARMANKSEAVNRQDAFAHAAEIVRQQIHDGLIDIPIEDAIHAALTAADSRDGQAADKIIGQIARGELGLDLWPDPRLSLVVVLGEGNRKVWRDVTAYDLKLMVELRKQNTNAARRSERRFLKDVAAVYDDLVTAGTVGSLVKSQRAAAA